MLNFHVRCFAPDPSTSNKTLELSIFDVIGKSLFHDGVTAETVARALSSAPDATTIKVLINSPGGSGFEGNTIRNLLAAQKARVEVEVVGVAASAGSIIAMSASPGALRMAENAQMMIHEASTHTQGGEREHKAQLAMLKNVNQAMARDYAARMGKPVAEVRELMSETTWLSAQDALEMKLIDEVTPARAPAQPPWDQQKVLSLYGSPADVPVAVAAMMGAAMYGGAVANNGPLPPQSAGIHVPGSTTTTSAGAVSPPPNTQEKEPMTFARVAMALGLPESADENSLLAKITAHREEHTRATQLVAEVEALAGGKRGIDALAVLRQHSKFAAEVEALASAKGPEALGALQAWKSAAEQLPSVQAQVQELKQANEDAERAQLVAKGQAERKLSPALIAHFKDKPVAELRGYLAVASPIIPEELKQPRTQASGDGSAPDLGGKRWEDLKPIEKHNLSVEAPEVYAALAEDYRTRTGNKVGKGREV